MAILVGSGILAMLLAVATFFASRTAPTVRFGLKPAILEVKTRNDGDKRTERHSLQELLKTRCQSLFSVFKPVWWLFKLVHSARVISTITDASKWTTPDHILCVSRLFKDRPYHLPKVVILPLRCITCGD
jgi:hypothetical protein